MNCLKSGPNGSCTRERVEGSLYCERHSRDAALVKTYILNDLKLSQDFERQGHANLYSLREELQLMRAMINDRLNLATNEAERLVAYNQVSQWIATVEKLVTSLNKLERETSQVLSREALMSVGKAIIEVISEEIKKLPGYENVIDAIAVRIVPVIEQVTNK